MLLRLRNGLGKVKDNLDRRIDRNSGCKGCFDKEKYNRNKRKRGYTIAKYGFFTWLLLFILQILEGLHTTMDWIAVVVYFITWITSWPDVKQLNKKYK